MLNAKAWYPNHGKSQTDSFGVSDCITTPDQYVFMDKPKLLGEVPYTQGFISTQHTSSSSSSQQRHNRLHYWDATYVWNNNNRVTCLIRIEQWGLPKHAFDTSHSSNSLSNTHKYMFSQSVRNYRTDANKHCASLSQAHCFWNKDLWSSTYCSTLDIQEFRNLDK